MWYCTTVVLKPCMHGVCVASPAGDGAAPSHPGHRGLGQRAAVCRRVAWRLPLCAALHRGLLLRLCPPRRTGPLLLSQHTQPAGQEVCVQHLYTLCFVFPSFRPSFLHSPTQIIHSVHSKMQPITPMSYPGSGWANIFGHMKIVFWALCSTAVVVLPDNRI